MAKKTEQSLEDYFKTHVPDTDTYWKITNLANECCKIFGIKHSATDESPVHAELESYDAIWPLLKETVSLVSGISGMLFQCIELENYMYYTLRVGSWLKDVNQIPLKGEFDLDGSVVTLKFIAEGVVALIVELNAGESAYKIDIKQGEFEYTSKRQRTVASAFLGEIKE